MAHSHPPSTMAAGHPLHWAFVQFPVVCFTLTLFTDLIYWATANLMWHNFSAWLLFSGLIFGVVAIVVGLIDLLVRPAMRAYRPGGSYLIGSAVVLLLGFINNLVHAGDGWTAIVPTGTVLSAVTVVAIIATDWFGSPAVLARRSGDRTHV